MLTEEWRKKFQKSEYEGKTFSVIGDSISAYEVYGFPGDHGYIESIPPNYSKEARQFELARQEYDISRAFPYEHTGNYVQLNDDATTKCKDWYDSEGNLTVKAMIPSFNKHGFFCISTEEMQQNLRLFLGCDYDQFSAFFDEVFNSYTTRMDIIKAILSNVEIQQAGSDIFDRVIRALQGFDTMRDDIDPYYDLNGTVVRNGAEKMWWHQFAQLSGMKPLRIYGWGGRCVTGIKQYKGGNVIYNRRKDGTAIYTNAGINLLFKKGLNEDNKIDDVLKPLEPNKDGSQKRVSLKGIGNTYFYTSSEGKAGQPYQRPTYDIRELKKLRKPDGENGFINPDVIIVRCMGNDATNVDSAVYTSTRYKEFDLLGFYDGSKTLKEGLIDFYGEDGIIFEDVEHIYILDRVKNGLNELSNDTLGKINYRGDRSVKPEKGLKESELKENGIVYKNGKRYISLERAIDEGHPAYYGYAKGEVDWIYEDKRRRYLCDFGLACALTMARLQYLYPNAEIYWHVMAPTGSIKLETDKIATRYLGASTTYTDGNNSVTPRKKITDYVTRLQKIAAAYGVNMIDAPVGSSRYSIQYRDVYIKYNYDRNNPSSYDNYTKYYDKIIFGSHLNEEGNLSVAEGAYKYLLTKKQLPKNLKVKQPLKVLVIGNQDGIDITRWLWRLLDKAGYEATVGQFFLKWGTLKQYYALYTGSEELPSSNFNYREYKHDKPIIIYPGDPKFDLDTILKKDWDICLLQPSKAEYGQLGTDLCGFTIENNEINENDDLTLIKDKEGNYYIEDFITETKNNNGPLKNTLFGLLIPWFMDPHYSLVSNYTKPLFKLKRWSHDEYKEAYGRNYLGYLEDASGQWKTTDSWGTYLKDYKLHDKTYDKISLIQKMTVEERNFYYKHYYNIVAARDNTSYKKYYDFIYNNFDFIIDCAVVFKLISYGLDKTIDDSKQEVLTEKEKERLIIAETSEEAMNNLIKTLKESVGGHLLATCSNTLALKSEDPNLNLMLEPTEDNIIEKKVSDKDNSSQTTTIKDDTYVISRKEKTDSTTGEIIDSAFTREYMITAEEFKTAEKELKNYDSKKRFYSEEEEEEEEEQEESKDDGDKSAEDEPEQIDDDDNSTDASIVLPSIGSPTIIMPLSQTGYSLSYYTAQYLFSYLTAILCSGIFEYVKNVDKIYDINGDNIANFEDTKNALEYAAKTKSAIGEDWDKVKGIDFNNDETIQASEAREVLLYFESKLNTFINKKIDWYPNAYDAWYINEQYQDIALQANSTTAKAARSLAEYVAKQEFYRIRKRDAKE